LFVYADRFEVMEISGRGASGVVHRAWDRQLSRQVALKFAIEGVVGGPTNLRREYHLREQVLHPGLVSMLELVERDGQMGLVMDWVEGPTLSAAMAALPPDARWPALTRLLRQAADALLALHDAGLAHGDLKPEHLICTAPDTVVLIDFDVSGRFRSVGSRSEDLDGGSGTQGYLAPELLRGATSGPASDVWSLGAVVYEVLQGHPPFHGDPDQTLLASSLGDAPPLRVDDAPPALVSVVASMLAPEPGARPTADQVVDLLSERGHADPDRVRRVFLGREPELTALLQADAAAAGGLVVATVLGPSGVGKTTLVEAFLTDVARARPGSTWRSRCYPDCSIPYPAVDGWIDDLLAWCQVSRATEREPATQAAIAALLPLFQRLDVLGVPPAAVEPDRAVLEAARAFVALVGRVAQDGPLRLWLDDAQWADDDSLPFLRELRLNGPAGVTLLLTARVRPAWAAAEPGGVSVDLELAGLGADAVVAWASRLRRDLEPSGVEALLQSTEGNPFLLTTVLSADPTRSVDPAAAMEQAHARLDPVARQVSQALAISVAPLDLASLDAVVGAKVPSAALQDLGRRGMVARVALTGRTAFEPAHDRWRIWEQQRATPDQTRDVHARLADALEARDATPPSVLFHHHAAAGRTDRALAHAHKAADEAYAKYAWADAAHFYAYVGEHAGNPAQAYVRRAEAVTRTGVIEAASRAWIEASEHLNGERASRARIRAAEIAFGAGRFDLGRARLDPMMLRLGLRWPRNLVETVARAFWWQTVTALWRLRGAPRGTPDARRSERIDVGWVLAGALGSVDFENGAPFQVSHAYEAARWGDARQQAQGLVHELAYRLTSARVSSGTRALVAKALAVAAQTEDVEQRALMHWGLGYGAFIRGEIDDAHTHLTTALESWRSMAAEGWERAHAERHLGWTLRYRGDYPGLRAFVDRELSNAIANGNRVQEEQIRVGLVAWLALVDDDPDRADHVVDLRRPGEVSSVPFGTQYLVLHSRVSIALVRGDLDAAAAAVEALRAHAWFLQSALHVRIEARLGAALVGAARRDRKAMARARADARHFERQPHRWAQAVGAAMRAAAAWVDGDVQAARSAYRTAAMNYDLIGMHAHRDLVLLYDSVLDGNQTSELELRDRLERRGIRSLSSWSRAVVPGPPL
jgi:hypothetical protein